MQVVFQSDTVVLDDSLVVFVVENEDFSDLAGIHEHLVYFDDLLSETIKKTCSRIFSVNNKTSSDGHPRSIMFTAPKNNVLLISMDKTDKLLCERDYKTLGGLIARLAQKQFYDVIQIFFGNKFNSKKASIIAPYICLGFNLGGYTFCKYRSDVTDSGQTTASQKELNTISSKTTKIVFSLSTANNARDLYTKKLLPIQEGVILARDLSNEPANIKTPAYLVQQCEKQRDLGVTVDVLGTDDMKKLGMNAALSVSLGSDLPSFMVVMKWSGDPQKKTCVGLACKGMTFDSGGVSLKPSRHMGEMKHDVSGAAAGIGLMHAIARRKLRCNVVMVAMFAENMLSGSATRPGDIVISKSGKSIEITDTDAEGRLVLADLLTYVQTVNSDVSIVIDIATLTGSVVAALGSGYAGLFCNNEILKKQLVVAGQMSGERVWDMPLDKEYGDVMKSKVADLRNFESGRGGAGAITAAKFLENFICNDVYWAHIDIGGTAYNSYSSALSPLEGATGYGVQLLMEWCEMNTGESMN